LTKKKTSKKSVKKTQVLDFEASMKELESLVERMEQGEQSLEDSLKDFERGITLTRNCQKPCRKLKRKFNNLSKKMARMCLLTLTKNESKKLIFGAKNESKKLIFGAKNESNNQIT
jgi:exodeoxyribonuclease VII small subunit